MPLPSKQTQLYERIRQELREKYQPGALLPSEPAYARYLGCGRSTLRKVLDVLQEERRIRRTRAGTIVLEENTGRLSVQDGFENPLYLLLPCPNYAEATDRFSYALTNQFIAGCIQGSVEAGRRLVTLPVSETNLDNRVECIDITWKQLSILRRGDLVLFLGRWYGRLIPFLEKTECITGFISQKPDLFPWFQGGNSAFLGYSGYSNWAFIQPAVHRLAQLNCRRIACLWFALDHLEQETVEKKYYGLLSELRLKGGIADIDFHASPEMKGMVLKQLVNRINPDALIVCPHLRNVPWPAGSSAWIGDRMLVTDQHTLRCGLSGTGKILLGKDDIAQTARRLVVRLLRGEYRSEPELYPYEFQFRHEIKLESDDL